MPCAASMVPGDLEEQIARRMRLVRERKAHVYERTRPNGTIVEVRGMPLDGGGFVTTYLDVTEQRRTQALIAHMAHHDTLTDLPNRALFADRLQTAIALAKRSGLVALHCLNIDKFKPINDTLGHDAGDALLIATADRLRKAVRENDTVARLSGDEFAIVQTGIREPADASVLARRVLSVFSSPFEILGTTVIARQSLERHRLRPEDGVTMDEVLRKADTALYHSKSRGGGRFSFFSDLESDPSRLESNQSTQCGLMVLIAMCCNSGKHGRAVIARRRRTREARNVRDSYGRCRDLQARRQIQAVYRRDRRTAGRRQVDDRRGACQPAARRQCGDRADGRLPL